MVETEMLRRVTEEGTSAGDTGLTLPDIRDSSTKAISEIVQLLEHEFYAAAAHARLICDAYWSNMQDEIDSGAKDATLQTRVRVIDVSLQAVWMRATGPARSGPSTGKYYAKQLPKGTASSNPNYSKSTFTRCPSWEKELCRVCGGSLRQAA
ncbi:conjugative transfer protein MobI(A/C) [Modicisalibacter luteus]|uniref:Conjugative transfer protein MobI(A/C) n=1 Tax=Modicisalibacter luteus TaxID=453962 RepID=A0ABV7LVG2_9GAMM|nr:conjugative transfer protein MobI(A/C) [Halomonas lutea]GHB14257.1 hypothetical protein GCM10007159_40800 [Halomonas lutea]